MIPAASICTLSCMEICSESCKIRSCSITSHKDRFKWNFKLQCVPVGNFLLLLPITMPNFDCGFPCRVLSYSTTPQGQRGLFWCFTVLRYHLSILIWDGRHEKPYIRMFLSFTLAKYLRGSEACRSLCSKHDTLLPTSICFICMSNLKNHWITLSHFRLYSQSCCLVSLNS